MKESADYQFLKTFLDNYIYHIRITYCSNEIERFKLDSLSDSQILSIVEIDMQKCSNYIEQSYLQEQFNEDKLIKLLCSLINPKLNYNTQYEQYWTPTIKYFKNLPLHIYFKVIQSNINIFENISEDTKNYNEIKEYYRFLKL